MIDKNLYRRKINELTDDKLKELLRLKNKENLDIMELAKEEAISRNLDLSVIEKKAAPKSGAMTKKEQGINWAGVLADILSGFR
jgi:hypothetical protein